MGMIDLSSERIAGRAHWFLQAYAWDIDDAMIGRQVVGVKAACRSAQHAHLVLLKTSPDFKCVGWDCMVTADGTLVWFEGNSGLLRLARVLSSSWEIASAILNTWT